MERIALAALLCFGLTPAIQSQQPKEGPALKAEILSVVALNYDPQTEKGSDLSELGPVSLGDRGIVGGKKAKSGWVNFRRRFKDIGDLIPGKSELELDGINLWVNDGGNNWLSFSVDKALLDQQEVSVKGGLERVSATVNRPFLILDGKYRLVVSYVDMSGGMGFKRSPAATIPAKKK